MNIPDDRDKFQCYIDSLKQALKFKRCKDEHVVMYLCLKWKQLKNRLKRGSLGGIREKKTEGGGWTIGRYKLGGTPAWTLLMPCLHPSDPPFPLLPYALASDLLHLCLSLGTALRLWELPWHPRKRIGTAWEVTTRWGFLSQWQTGVRVGNPLQSQSGAALHGASQHSWVPSLTLLLVSPGRFL